MRSRRALFRLPAASVLLGVAACSASSPGTPSADAGDATARGSHDGGRDATTDGRHAKDAPGRADVADVDVAYDVTGYDGLAPDAAPARVPVHAELVS